MPLSVAKLYGGVVVPDSSPVGSWHVVEYLGHGECIPWPDAYASKLEAEDALLRYVGSPATR